MKRTHECARMLCVSHGRPATISEDLASAVVHTRHDVNSPAHEDHQLPYADYVSSALKLYEINRHAAQKYISLTQSNTTNGDQPGILDPSSTEEQLALMLKIDGCLRRWKRSLPGSLKYECSSDLQDDASTRHSTVLHLR